VDIIGLLAATVAASGFNSRIALQLDDHRGSFRGLAGRGSVEGVLVTLGLAKDVLVDLFRIFARYAGIDGCHSLISHRPLVSFL
jgi:hypothetical protein